MLIFFSCEICISDCISHLNERHVDTAKFTSVGHVRQFEKIEKSLKMTVFFAFSGLILAMFLTFQSYDFDAFAHAGGPLGVE